MRAFFSANGLLAALIAMGATLFLTYDRSRVEQGKKIQEAKQVKTNEKAKTKIRKARSRVKRNGAADRVRKRWCRNC